MQLRRQPRLQQRRRVPASAVRVHGGPARKLLLQHAREHPQADALELQPRALQLDGQYAPGPLGHPGVQQQHHLLVHKLCRQLRGAVRQRQHQLCVVVCVVVCVRVCVCASLGFFGCARACVCVCFWVCARVAAQKNVLLACIHPFSLTALAHNPMHTPPEQKKQHCRLRPRELLDRCAWGPCAKTIVVRVAAARTQTHKKTSSNTRGSLS